MFGADSKNDMRQEFFTLSELLAFTAANPHSNTKAFYLLGYLKQPVAQTVALLVDSDELIYELVVDSDAIRHIFAQHGAAKSQLEAKRGQLPITEAEILYITYWLPNVTTAASGQAKPGKQPRVEVELTNSTGTTVAILEWRPGRRQLALVTMYKKRPAA